MFDNARDANQYLANTVCYWDGVPFYIERVSEGLLARGYRLPVSADSVRENVLVTDARFNCREFRLGYMNHGLFGRAIFVSRHPARHVQQGLADVNINFQNNGERMPDGRWIELGIAQAIREPGFVDMLTGRYPSIDEAHQMLARPDIVSVALSKWVAIKKHAKFKNLYFLEYKGRDVAFSDTHHFQLPDEARYLTEICTPCGVLRPQQAA